MGPAYIRSFSKYPVCTNSRFSLWLYSKRLFEEFLKYEAMKDSPAGRNCICCSHCMYQRVFALGKITLCKCQLIYCGFSIRFLGVCIYLEEGSLIVSRFLRILL